MKKFLIITIILLNFISIKSAQRTFEILFWNKGEKININSDAQRIIYLVHYYATKWKINIDSIGIMELSAEKYHVTTSNLTING